MQFNLDAPFQPTGDQPDAIRLLVEGIDGDFRNQVLLGATGTGKTYTIASVIEHVQKPTLVMAHNKTLAAQLYAEFKDFFPENAVEYFVSYYDYYQPEAYVPRHDLYIEKETEVARTPLLPLVPLGVLDGDVDHRGDVAQKLLIPLVELLAPGFAGDA